MSKKIAFRTLGCRLNQFETDAIASKFHKHQYEIVNFEQDADVYVINTCTVTNQGDQKSRQEIHKALKKGIDPVVVVTGCMVNNYKDKLDNFEGVSYFIENSHKKSIYDVIEAHYRGETLSPADLQPDIFGFEPAEKTFHTRSMIKIQDGCDNFCTFCIVPKVRGRATSRPVNDIKENIKKVIDFGFKEIVLTGVNIGRYNYQETDFEHLVEEILEIPGDFRVRISSIEPEGFGDHLFSLFEHPKLTPHLHLCLQSGSDKTLLKMRRMYNLKTFLNMTSKIKSRYPDFNLTTDIIVGFPGETEKEFEDSCKVVRDIGFSHIHTFKYSVRNGTRAARMEEQVPEKVKNERSRIIRDISLENKIKYQQSLLGKHQRVLIERINSKGIAKGYGEHYVPVKFKTDLKESNRFADVKLGSVQKGQDPLLIGS
ncbi:MAG: tRNA (N(6)-L-threonylcarbamoyladenosine(37)-C(2))-methylthiotransferase MtaB [Bacteroidota bacterium]|nr:tRNA (N(6)-L-threonylcarbamoyladenosine(37)-C(2))-methylthiotransferase MtaB [Bacteroidota bacterium]